MKKIISIALILVFVASTIFIVTPFNIKAANAAASDNYVALNDAQVVPKATFHYKILLYLIPTLCHTTLLAVS